MGQMAVTTLPPPLRQRTPCSAGAGSTSTREMALVNTHLIFFSTANSSSGRCKFRFHVSVQPSFPENGNLRVHLIWRASHGVVIRDPSHSGLKSRPSGDGAPPKKGLFQRPKGSPAPKISAIFLGPPKMVKKRAESLRHETWTIRSSNPSVGQIVQIVVQWYNKSFMIS